MRLFLLCTLFVLTNAQVIYKQATLRPRFEQYLSEPSIQHFYNTFSLPEELDNIYLAEQENAKDGVYYFGKGFEVDLDLKDGTWISLPDGSKLWRLGLRSHNAYSLNVLFSEFKLPVDTELYLTTEQEVFGPFTSENNKLNGQFSTIPLAGNKLVLELYQPAQVLEEPQLRISNLVHGYRDFKQGQSGKCNINVACEERKGWEDQINSVVMMMTQQGQGFCSGSLLNNIKQDGRQLYLTAYHCTNRDNSNNILLFNYQSKGCHVNELPSDYKKQSVHGLKKLAGHFSSDFAIFEVEERIPDSYGAYLSGWEARGEHVPQNAVGIHHPSVDLKKISFSEGNCSGTCWGGACGVRGKFDHWKINQWAKGTTEPGSSGSPLFDGNSKRIVGQLHGGTASCYNPKGYDAYGAIFASVSQGELGKVLDPEQTGQLFLDGKYLKDLRKQQSTVQPLVMQA